MKAGYIRAKQVWRWNCHNRFQMGDVDALAELIAASMIITVPTNRDRIPADLSSTRQLLSDRVYYSRGTTVALTNAESDTSNLRNCRRHEFWLRSRESLYDDQAHGAEKAGGRSIRTLPTRHILRTVPS